MLLGTVYSLVYLSNSINVMFLMVYAVISALIQSPLSLSTLWVRFSLRTHVKRVSQRSAESLGFSPGTPPGKVDRVGYRISIVRKVISQLLL
jgi:hypothetical protein